MEERVTMLRGKLQRLLKEAAQVELELSREEGAICGMPHYSDIESRAHQLGRQLSQQVQARQMGELVAQSPARAKCPACTNRCEVEPYKRQVTSIDGPVEILESMGYCPVCRRAFFPRPRNIGL